MVSQIGFPQDIFWDVTKLAKDVWFTVTASVGFRDCMGLVICAPDYQQGHSVRIMYVHVPAAAVAQTCYLIMAVSSAVFLIWNIKLADWAAKSMAPIGASLAFLVLITGAIWGKPTWALGGFGTQD